MSALLALRERVDADGGLLAGALRPIDAVAAERPEMGERVAAGPRTADDPAAYAFVVEAILEGFLLHGPEPARVIDKADADLALLAGDRLYALGLQELAELGDLEAVEALSGVIALATQARAAGDDELVAAVWEAGLLQVATGDGRGLQAAREAARTGDPSAVHAVQHATRMAPTQVPPPA